MTLPVPLLRWLSLAPLVLWVALMLFLASRSSEFYFSRNAKSLLGVLRSALQGSYHVGAFMVLVAVSVFCLAAAGMARAGPRLPP